MGFDCVVAEMRGLQLRLLHNRMYAPYLMLLQLAGQELSTERIPLKVQLIAPPLYVMTTSCLDKAAGISALEDAIAAVKRVIDARGGQLNVKMAVRRDVKRPADSVFI